jgi:hypothetical protein
MNREQEKGSVGICELFFSCLLLLFAIAILLSHFLPHIEKRKSA